MPVFIQYVRLIIMQGFAKQSLDRLPEPAMLTEGEGFVEDYSRVMTTIMVFPYLLILNMVKRLSSKEKNIKALDLCCGPGHYTRLFSQHFSCDEVSGVDLSEPMLEKANEAARKENLPIKYLKADVTDLKIIPSDSMDVVSFMDGAHHMDSLEMVTKVLLEADRIARPEGIVIVLDPVRPKTLEIANFYHRVSGKSYVDLGLHHFNKDFYNSLRASWTIDEFHSALPMGTRRNWVQIIPSGYPSFQVIVGLPEGRKEVFIKSGFPKDYFSNLIPKINAVDWFMFNMTFNFSKKIFLK